MIKKYLEQGKENKYHLLSFIVLDNFFPCDTEAWPKVELLDNARTEDKRR